MSLSDIDAADFLAAKFRGAALTVPAEYQVGWSSTAPGDDGSDITEPDDPDYARVPIPTDADSWTDPTTDPEQRQIANAIDIRFAVGSVDWDDQRYWVLYDGARYVIAGRLARAVTVKAGVPAVLQAGDLVIPLAPSRYSL